MSHAIVMYNGDNYSSYKLAYKDGATYATHSTVDATDGLTGILDTLEVIRTLNECLNADTVAMICGVMHQGECIALQDIADVCDGRAMSVDMAITLLYQRTVPINVVLSVDELVTLVHTLADTNSYLLDKLNLSLPSDLRI